MFLLPTQALMDIICEDPAMTAWIRPVPAQDIHASARFGRPRPGPEILATSLEEGREVMDLALRAFAPSPAGTTLWSSSTKGQGPSSP